MVACNDHNVCGIQVSRGASQPRPPRCKEAPTDVRHPQRLSDELMHAPNFKR